VRVYKGNIKKKVTVRLIGDADSSFIKLEQTILTQKQKGITSSKEITLQSAILRMIELITSNPFYGENAKKALIPRAYVNQYDVTNIFIADLPDYWRLIYTLESDEIQIIAFVLDIFDPEEYNKKFGFKKK
jgi:Txe/YoeB family toxin of Txe-Axe toxin-antitoxin module